MCFACLAHIALISTIEFDYVSASRLRRRKVCGATWISSRLSFVDGDAFATDGTEPIADAGSVAHPRRELTLLALGCSAHRRTLSGDCVCVLQIARHDSAISTTPRSLSAITIFCLIKLYLIRRSLRSTQPRSFEINMRIAALARLGQEKVSIFNKS